MAIKKEVLEKIKKDLLARKKQVEKDLESFTSQDDHEKDKHRTKFPQYGDKLDDNAQEISEYSTNIATEKVLEDTLRDIENTLKRIEKGTYGICKYCKKDINEKRLLARPVASSCVDCKKKLQQAV